MAKVKTIQQMLNTVRPEVGELDEEGNEGGGEFADDKGTTSVCQRPDKPADEALQKLLCFIFSQIRAGLLSALHHDVDDKFMFQRDGVHALPLGVELDNDGQSAEELDLVIRSSQHAMGKLPTGW